MTNLPLRMLGVAVLLAAVVIYDANTNTLLHRLLIPATMAVATWLIVQNLAAVLLAVTVIAGTRINLDSADVLPSLVYPVIALLAGGGLAAIGVARFRQRIIATREARWRNRSTEP